MAITEYFGFNTFAFLTTIIILLFWYFKKTYSYWTDRNVVSLPTLPIIGTQLEFLKIKKQLGMIAQDVYNKHPNERFVGGFKAFEPELLLRDPEIIRMMMVKDANYFIDRPVPSNDKEFFTLNLFNMRGEKWRYLRQKLTPTFTSSKMRKMFPLIEECGKELQSYLLKSSKINEFLEIKEIMAQFTTETIGSCAFGIKMNAMSEEGSYFRKIGRAFFEPSKIRIVSDFLYALMPKLMNFVGIKFQSTFTEDSDRFFIKIVKDLFESRNNTPSKRNDFIDLMIELRNNGFVADDKFEKSAQEKENVGQSFELSDKVIAAQALVFFLAGFETSSTVMSYALREMSLNLEIQKKLADEIDTVLKKHDGRLSYEAVQEMKYLDMVIDESLRKYPPVVNLLRICNAKYKIPTTDIVIDKGVQIVIPVYALHHDPQYFPEPEKFIPERFAPDAEKTYHPYSYLPFGEGPRNCIGMRFGRLQSATGLVSVLREFSWEASEQTRPSLKFDPACSVLTSMGGFLLKLNQRPKALGVK